MRERKKGCRERKGDPVPSKKRYSNIILSLAPSFSVVFSFPSPCHGSKEIKSQFVHAIHIPHILLPPPHFSDTGSAFIFIHLPHLSPSARCEFNYPPFLGMALLCLPSSSPFPGLIFPMSLFKFRLPLHYLSFCTGNNCVYRSSLSLLLPIPPLSVACQDVNIPRPSVILQLYHRTSSH